MKNIVKHAAVRYRSESNARASRNGPVVIPKSMSERCAAAETDGEISGTARIALSGKRGCLDYIGWLPDRSTFHVQAKDSGVSVLGIAPATSLLRVLSFSQDQSSPKMTTI